MTQIEEVSVTSTTIEIEITEVGALSGQASDPTGRTWDAILIKSGTSGNRRHYPAQALKEAAPLFENARAFTNHPSRSEQRDRPERDVRDICGWWTGVRWDDQEQGLRGNFHISESADWLRVMLKDAWQRNQPQLIGFSINASGRRAQRPHTDGSELIEAITSVASVDVVTSPGAKGGILRVLESTSRETTVTMTDGAPPAFDQNAFKTDLLESVKQMIADQIKPPAAVVDAETSRQITDLQEAAAQIAELQQAAKRSDELKESLRQIQEANREAAERLVLTEQRQLVRDKVDAAGLPKASADRLRTKLLETVERRRIDEAEIDAEVGYMRDMIRESGPATVAWGGTVATGDDFNDKFGLGIDGFFQRKDVGGVKRFDSLHRMDLTWRQGKATRQVDPLSINAYSLMESLSGSRYDSALVDLRESMTTASWGEVFADKLYKNMLREYNDPSKYDDWRKMVSEIESVPSFQTRHFMRTGGYANLPTVAEQGTYTSLTSPTDEEITYAIAKRGGLEDITFEMLQDPTASNKISMIPMKLGRSAKRTLYTFVFNSLLASNPTMDYDSVALFNSAHSNTDTSAGLSVGKLQTGWQKMRDQTAYNESSEVLGILNRPKYLLVPNELEGIADRLVNGPDAYYAAIASSTDTDQALDPARFRGRFEIIVVDIWTDVNDWMLVADPAQVNTIVLGFLNGREEPELFVQDNPTVGSVFTADKISYKVRHIYGGDVADHRSFYLGVG